MFGFKKKKKYKIPGNKIQKLIESNEGCIATDRITVDGCKVGFMYREVPSSNNQIAVGALWLEMRTMII